MKLRFYESVSLLQTLYFMNRYLVTLVYTLVGSVALGAQSQKTLLNLFPLRLNCKCRAW
jgi:hypothetical protein